MVYTIETIGSHVPHALWAWCRGRCGSRGGRGVGSLPGVVILFSGSVAGTMSITLPP